ncbi:MAG: hypothetical protein WA814_07560 [Candidatus Baltobacteraceae bacterium]
MENVHAERSAGWSVLCYVGVLVLATLLNNGMPSIDVKPADAALMIDSHRNALLLGAWLTFPASAFFLWFLVGLRSYLGHAPGRQEGLPTLAMIAGVVMVAGSLWAAGLQTVAVYVLPDTFQANGLESIYDAFLFIQGGLGYAPVAIFLFASAHSMRRHHSAPGWLATLGYLAGCGATIATLSIFFTYSFMAPGAIGPGAIGALPAAIWLIATGIVLVQSSRGSGSSSASGAS